MLPLHARIATTGNTKRMTGRAYAKPADPANLQAMTIPPRAPAHIASLADTNRIQEKPNASHVFLAHIKQP
jgi:hypothetical protein